MSGIFGAGEGNRTLINSLGSCRITTMLRPLMKCFQRLSLSPSSDWLAFGSGWKCNVSAGENLEEIDA